MYKFFASIIFLLSFSISLISQNQPEPCTIQSTISLGLCLDTPGCWIFTAKPTGGKEPYTYLWSNGATTKEIVFPNDGVNGYQGTCEIVTVTDADGCIAVVGEIHDYVVNPHFGLAPDTIIANGTPTNFDVSINDTVSNLTFELVQPPTFGSVTFDADGQGVYTPNPSYCGPDYFRYLVYDSNCHYSRIETATVLNGPCAKIILTSNNCNNECTGSTFFYNQGIFTPPLTYDWSNGGTENAVHGLCSGNISVTVTDALGASQVYQDSIEEVTTTVDIIAFDEACQFSKVHLSPTFTQSPIGDLDFTWSGNGIYPSIQNDTTQFAPMGNSDSTRTFRLILDSSNGCSDTAYHTIEVFQAPRIIQIKGKKIVCPLDTIELTPILQNGTPPYSYQWQGPLGLQSNEPLFVFPNATPNHAGTYKLSLTDQNGCLAIKTKNVSVPDSLNFQVSAWGPFNTLCEGSDLKLFFGANTGSFTPPQKVEWTGPNNFYSTESEPILENIQSDMAGFYKVKVTYGDDCFLVDSTEVLVSTSAAEVTDVQITPPIGCFTFDAQIVVTMSVPPPYSVSKSWVGGTDNFTTNPFTLDDGRDGDYHSIEITTSNCVVFQALNIPKPDIPTVLTTDATCLGNDGTATVVSPNNPQVSARFQAPNTAWNDFVTGLFVENLIPRTYNVYIKDSVTNCQFTEQITIAPYLDFEVIVVDTPSCDNALGSLEVTSTGQPTLPISFDWSNNVSGIFNGGLEDGWYSVTMTDGDGCQRHENVFLPADEPCNSVISGHAYFNFDCDCSATNGDDMPYNNLRICADFNGYKDCFYTDNNGAFWLVPPVEGDYTLTAYPTNDLVQGTCSPLTITIPNNQTVITDADFFFCGDTITDLRVDAYCHVARPGFTQQYIFQVENEGTSFTDTITDLTVDLEDNLDITYITPTPLFQDLTTNQITWGNLPIEFNARKEFRINATVNASLGDTLLTTANVVSNNDDVDLNNNYAKCEQIVVGSYDPNDKLVNPLGSGDGGNISVADTMFNYTIRFQNTGTDTAFTVVVRDTLDGDVFDLNSVYPRMASHPYQLDVEGENILVFLFENINLPDSNRNLAGSQGFITFDISLKPDLPLGTYIQNMAAIYFDFNEPIITNTASNFLTTQKDIFQNEAALKVYPNPFRNNAFAKINLTKSVQSAQLDLFSLDGKLVKTILPPTSLSEGEIIVPFETNRLSSGIYFIYLKTEKGNVVEKMVKVRY